MPAPPTSTPLARAGVAIALVALAGVFALGSSRQTVAPVGEGSAVACGSVFSPVDEPSCDDIRADRKSFMLAIGIPGVVLGLGIVVVAGLRERRARE